MERVLIAGGAGFIGTHLIRRLLKKDTYITVVDNLSTGRLENINSFLNREQFTFYNVDLGKENSLKFLEGQKFDYIYNLACPANPPYCFSHSLDVIRVNYYGTLQLAEIARINKAVFFQASSSEVYGNPTNNVQSEHYHGNVNPYGIRACYDEGKRCAETILYDYHRLFGLDVRVARIFNTYGANMSLNDGRVIVQFIKNALTNKPLIIKGTGNQTRSFCYVDDLVEGIIKLMSLKEMPPHPINLGNDEEYTINYIAERIIEITQSKSNIIHVDGTADDPQQRKPDVAAAKRILCWNATIPFDEGIKKIIPYYEAIIGISKPN